MSCVVSVKCKSAIIDQYARKTKKIRKFYENAYGAAEEKIDSQSLLDSVKCWFEWSFLNGGTCHRWFQSKPCDSEECQNEKLAIEQLGHVGCYDYNWSIRQVIDAYLKTKQKKSKQKKIQQNSLVFIIQWIP